MSLLKTDYIESLFKQNVLCNRHNGEHEEPLKAITRGQAPHASRSVVAHLKNNRAHEIIKIEPKRVAS